MADDETQRFDSLWDSKDFGLLAEYCWHGALDDCPQDVLEGLTYLVWRRFVNLSGMAELSTPPRVSDTSQMPDFVEQWVRENRWVLAWDYSLELNNVLNFLDMLLKEIDSRAGRTTPEEDEPKRFLRQAVSTMLHGRSEAYYLRADWGIRLWIGDEDSDRERAELQKRLGQEPDDWDVVGAVLDERITRARSFHILSILYHEKALFQHWRGTNCVEELQQAARMRLLHYQQHGVNTVFVKTVLAQFVCEACQQQKNMHLRVDEALQKMPIPNLACTSAVGYCRCFYFRGFD